MSNLIDTSFFSGQINIPNTGYAPVAEQLNWAIKKYEPEFLQAALGYDLYKALRAGLATMSPVQKWVDLRDGKEYVRLDGRNDKWRGLTETIITGQKQSPIANYIYYWFMRNNATQTAGIGEVVTNAENASPSSPGLKMSTAWNEMVKWVRELWMFLDSNQDTYTEYDISEKYACCDWLRISPYSRLRPINAIGF